MTLDQFGMPVASAPSGGVDPSAISEAINTHDDDSGAHSELFSALAERVSDAETALVLAGRHVAALENEARDAWEDFLGPGNVRGGYTLPVIGYDDDGDSTFALLFATDDTELDLAKFTPGQHVAVSLVVGDPQDRDSYALTDAVVAEVDAAGKRILLAASLRQGDVSSSLQIGFDKKTVSGYTNAATGGPTAYRVTFSGAGNDHSLVAGLKVYTRAGAGAIVANSIAGTNGNYIYLNSAAAGTTAIYLPPSNTFVSNLVPEENDSTITVTGESNFVAGEASGAVGSLNTVVGVGSYASGGQNTVSGDFSEAHGEGNRVNGTGSYAVGVGNTVTESLSVALGNGNKHYAQGTVSLGDGNILAAVNALAVGWMNRLKAYCALAVGSANEIHGRFSTEIGFYNKVRAVSSFVFGRYADVDDAIGNKNAFIFHGGSKEKNGTALAVRTLKAVANPAYTQGGTEPEFIEETAFSTEFRGRLSPVTLDVAGTGTVTLDHDMYGRWKLTGTGAVTVAADNWIDGDRGELVFDSSVTTVSFPANWVVAAAVSSATPGIRLLEIRKELGSFFVNIII